MNNKLPIAKRIFNRAARTTGVVKRSLLYRNVPIELKCGTIIRVDRRHPQWNVMASRGYHELGTERFLASYLQEGDVVVDVGSHIGMFAAVAAKLVGTAGHVYTFDIDEINFRELKKTIARNDLHNIQPEFVALGDHVGEIEFVRPVGSWGAFITRGTNTTLPISGNRSGKIVRGRCQSTTLDEYFGKFPISRLDLIKLDIDGPELAVLKGGLNTLQRYSPALIVEVSEFTISYGFSIEEVLEFILDLGYTLHASVNVEDRVVPVYDPTNIIQQIMLEHRSINLFCHKPPIHGDRWSRLWFAGNVDS
jgi:FkbM family methyltransferase